MDAHNRGKLMRERKSNKKILYLGTYKKTYALLATIPFRFPILESHKSGLPLMKTRKDFPGLPPLQLPNVLIFLHINPKDLLSILSFGS